VVVAAAVSDAATGSRGIKNSALIGAHLVVLVDGCVVAVVVVAATASAAGSVIRGHTSGLCCVFTIKSHITMFIS
jgi:hypothetical protein